MKAAFTVVGEVTLNVLNALSEATLRVGNASYHAFQKPGRIQIIPVNLAKRAALTVLQPHIQIALIAQQNLIFIMDNANTLAHRFGIQTLLTIYA